MNKTGALALKSSGETKSKYLSSYVTRKFKIVTINLLLESLNKYYQQNVMLNTTSTSAQNCYKVLGSHV